MSTATIICLLWGLIATEAYIKKRDVNKENEKKVEYWQNRWEDEADRRQQAEWELEACE